MSKGFYLDTPSQLSDEDTRSQVSRQFVDSEDDNNDNNDNDDDDDDDDDDLSSLPYPQPLQRSAFLKPDFKAADYLSTLRNRHQTLSDLRAELRTRSQSLAKELLDLVNDEYQAFLGLGGDLRGGDEKVEAVRVGVLGFVKGVEGVKGAVTSRRDEVDALLEEKKEIAGQILVGRQLVEVHTQIGELEETLAITSTNGHKADKTEGQEEENGEADSEDSDEDEDDDGQDVSGVARLERAVLNYLAVQQMIEQTGRDHPFLIKQTARLDKIRSTILLDLGTALKQAKAAGSRGKTKLLRVVALYGDLNEARDAIKILKDTRKR